MIKNGRILCAVPFCKRTAPASRWPDADEMICGKHWRGVSLEAKRLYRKMRRRVRPANAPFWNAAFWHWERCKRQAIEAAAGLS